MFFELCWLKFLFADDMNTEYLNLTVFITKKGKALTALPFYIFFYQEN